MARWRCETCRWWTREWEGDAVVRMGGDVDDATDVPLPADGAAVVGYNRRHLALLTGPAFGCVHWEGKHAALART